MRSPKWIGYALARHFELKVAHKGNNDPKDLERPQNHNQNMA